MKFFHHNGNEAQTSYSHRRLHKQILQKTDLCSIYNYFGTIWHWSITSMFIFQFLEFTTEKNNWQCKVTKLHTRKESYPQFWVISNASSWNECSQGMNLTYQVCREPPPHITFITQMSTCTELHCLVLFSPQILTYWCFSFPRSKMTVAFPTLIGAFWG